MALCRSDLSTHNHHSIYTRREILEKRYSTRLAFFVRTEKRYSGSQPQELQYRREVVCLFAKLSIFELSLANSGTSCGSLIELRAVNVASSKVCICQDSPHTTMSSVRIARAALRARSVGIARPVQRRGYADAVSDKIKLSLALPHQVCCSAHGGLTNLGNRSRGLIDYGLVNLQVDRCVRT